MRLVLQAWESSLEILLEVRAIELEETEPLSAADGTMVAALGFAFRSL